MWSAALQPVRCTLVCCSSMTGSKSECKTPWQLSVSVSHPVRQSWWNNNARHFIFGMELVHTIAHMQPLCLWQQPFRLWSYTHRMVQMVTKSWTDLDRPRGGDKAVVGVYAAITWGVCSTLNYGRCMSGSKVIEKDVSLVCVFMTSWFSSRAITWWVSDNDALCC